MALNVGSIVKHRRGNSAIIMCGILVAARQRGAGDLLSSGGVNKSVAENVLAAATLMLRVTAVLRGWIADDAVRWDTLRVFADRPGEGVNDGPADRVP